MEHLWNTDEDELLRRLLTVDGHTYESAAHELLNAGYTWATRDAVRGRARRKGINPERSASLALMPVDIPPGVVGGTRFKRVQVPVSSGTRFMIVNDTQFPFHDAETLRAVETFMFDYEPDVLILNGDIWDFYELSDFDKNPQRGFNFHDEITIGRRITDRWAHRLHRARRIIVSGNHEDRLRRFLWKHPQLASMPALDLQQILAPDDSYDVLAYGSQVQIAHMLIEHGSAVRRKAGQSAQAMMDLRGMSGLMGHTHRASKIEHTDARGGQPLFYIENGCMCLLTPEYTSYPNWQQAFTFGHINNGSVHTTLVDVLEDGFRADGRWYRRG